MLKRNFYEILNSQPNASFEVLKANYKQLILQCHPDKLNKDNATVTAGDSDPNASATSDNFVVINEAWHTLKDPARRKLYDAELLLTKFQTHNNIFEQLSLDDMKRQQAASDDDEEEAENDVGRRATNAGPMTATQTKTKTPTWYYTYACRCGGQYIIDESAADEIFNRSSSGIAVADCDRAANDDCEVGVDAATTDVDDADDAEVIVECSECSLVIVLQRRRQKPQNKHNNNNS